MREDARSVLGQVARRDRPEAVERRAAGGGARHGATGARLVVAETGPGGWGYAGATPVSATGSNPAEKQRTRPAPVGRSALLARMAALLVLLVYAAGMFVNAWVERRLDLQSEDSLEDLVLFVGFGMFAVVGALLVAKRPDNRVGWIIGAAALIVGIFPASETYAAYVMTTAAGPTRSPYSGRGRTAGTGCCSSGWSSSTCRCSSPTGACSPGAGFPSPSYRRSGSPV